MKTLYSTYKILASLAVVVVTLMFIPGQVIALSDAQYNTLNSGIYYFDTDVSDCGTNGAVSSISTLGGNIDQVKTFASEPITSTWNISDNAAEQWFLKQSGARATITKYGLNSSNISEITSAVRAANVSPVFFYLYTVNEGGGAGGFINHFSKDTGNGGPADATRDAEYLASQAQNTNGKPATGGGEPADMPTEEAQQILNSLPAGSIGKIYIQATSAVTAELEDLSGNSGDWSGLFGKPLSEAMQNIQKMGGDPMQGGVSDCTNSVTAEGIAKAISWATMIANNNGYGYDQPTRASGWAKWQSDPSCSTQCGSFDCSSFLAAALTEAGYFSTNPEFATGNEASGLANAGFTQVASSAVSSANLQPGDILITDGHTAMYVGNNQLVQASINENGEISGGEVGDQTGKEIAVRSFYNDNWTSVWRASN